MVCYHLKMQQFPYFKCQLDIPQETPELPYRRYTFCIFIYAFRLIYIVFADYTRENVGPVLLQQ